MTAVGDLEIQTQQRVITLFRDRLGYFYPGTGESGQTTATLSARSSICPSPVRVTRPTSSPRQSASSESPTCSAETAPSAAPTATSTVSFVTGQGSDPGVGEQTVSVHLIEWEDPATSNFAITNEVTAVDNNTKRCST